MKTQDFLINNQSKSTTKCESTSMSLGSSPSFYWARLLSLVKTSFKSFKSSESRILNASNSENSNSFSRISRALADRAGVVKNSHAIAKAFPRMVIGLFILIVAAPYADVFYTKLDFNARVSPEVWYYESYHWLFLCLGPYIKGMLVTIGWYLIFGFGHLLAKPIVAYQLMWDSGKILWLLQVTTHEEYKSLPPDLYIFGYGLAAAILLIILIDRLSYWLHHRVMAIKARLQGLRNIADKVDAQVIVSGFVRTMDDDVRVNQFKKA